MVKVGLVLSGGGVRGVAHLGALTFMEEMGIEIDVVSGTSAGSIVGCLYAAGHPIERILDVFKNTSIFSWSNFTARKPGLIDSDRFDPVLRELLPEDDFAALKKKAYVTATDLLHGVVVTFSEGKLVKPILASCAIPVVFSPVTIGNSLYVDGGVLNNFPIEPLQGRCSAIIGINVHPMKDVTADEMKSTLAIMERLLHVTIYHQTRKKLPLCNIVISPPELSNFGTFDRNHFEEIFEIGYKAAKAQKEAFQRLKEGIVEAA
ncbi:MAG: phospholipase [Saprospiraceae bacterium]|nr:MAG: phospholipase [Saprospiraceae bacterium]